MSPARIWSSVDLPVPFRPMTAIRSPASTCSADFVEQRQVTEGEGDVVEDDEHPATVTPRSAKCYVLSC